MSEEEFEEALKNWGVSSKFKNKKDKLYKMIALLIFIIRNLKL
jgi:hypothetical protein